jgi:hypothetical protein
VSLLSCQRPDWLAMRAAVTLALGLATVAWAQSSNSHPNRPVSKLQPTSPTNKWRTPKEQLWCPVLESALGSARTSEPPIRSYLLDAIAAGLSKCDPGQVSSVLADSFAATLEMPEHEDIWQRISSDGKRIDLETREALDNLETKRRLQETVLTQLLAVDEQKAESLLSQAEPSVSAEFLGSMISRATSAKKFGRALELLNRMPPEEGFPYQEATQLMLELPPDRDTDKQDIFRLAMARRSQSHLTGSDDFASMIVRFWQHVPPELALEAIHQVLDAAEHRAGTGVTLNATSGNLGFAAEYDYRVFELLPVLRQLDDEEADKILKDSQQTQLQLKQFPNGIQSLDPSIKDTPPRDGEAGQGLGMSFGPPNKTAEDLERSGARVKEIGRTAEDNPRQAIAAAATLPESVEIYTGLESFPRAQAYVAIARAAMKKNPSAARDALEEMAASLKHATYPHRAMENWSEGMAIAKEIGDVDLEVKLFQSGMEQVDKLRSEDTDSDDPNLALKAWWPSVNAYWQLVRTASEFSPDTALAQVREIRDQEILVFLEVKLANKGLGARAEQSITMVSKKRLDWSEFHAPEK